MINKNKKLNIIQKYIYKMEKTKTISILISRFYKIFYYLFNFI